MISRTAHFISYFKIAHNGRSHLMMNTMIRDKKRTERLKFDQLKQEKEAFEEMKHEIQDFREQLKLLKRNDKDDSKHANILKKLFKMGIIDKEGNPLQM